MTYDNLFRDRATWGRTYGCVIEFTKTDGSSVDMTGITDIKMDFKTDFSDTAPTFSLTLSDGLSWENANPAGGALQVIISNERMSVVSYGAPAAMGNEVPTISLYGDIKITPPKDLEILYDEGTVPKLFLDVEQRVSGA